jgi:hypothetical protein
MSKISIRTSLPKTVLDGLRSTGAVFHEKCEIKVIEVSEKPAIEVFGKFLSDSKEVDPVLIPNFGHIAAVYVPLNIQQEVYQLLNAYQPLLAADLTPTSPQPQLTPFANIVIPLGGGIQYHHAQIAIQFVMQQIENPDPGFNLVGINHLPSGQVICDLKYCYMGNESETKYKLHGFICHIGKGKDSGHYITVINNYVYDDTSIKKLKDLHDISGSFVYLLFYIKS